MCRSELRPREDVFTPSVSRKASTFVSSPPTWRRGRWWRIVIVTTLALWGTERRPGRRIAEGWPVKGLLSRSTATVVLTGVARDPMGYAMFLRSSGKPGWALRPILPADRHCRVRGHGLPLGAW